MKKIDTIIIHPYQSNTNLKENSVLIKRSEPLQIRGRERI